MQCSAGLRVIDRNFEEGRGVCVCAGRVGGWGWGSGSNRSKCSVDYVIPDRL